MRVVNSRPLTSELRRRRRRCGACGASEAMTVEIPEREYKQLQNASRLASKVAKLEAAIESAGRIAKILAAEIRA